MALMQPVADLFTDEWERFNKGLALLDRTSAKAYEDAFYRRKRNPNGTVAINIPEWSGTFKLEGPGPFTQEGAQEYYRAKREKRAPNLSAPEIAELRRREIQKDRMAQSAVPEYLRGFGSILTAVDNIQDFVSTSATFARLGLWGLPVVTQWMAPGASAGTATALAQIAERRAAAAAATAFAETIAARAAAGEALALAAQRSPTLFASAQAIAARAAGEHAFKLAFNRATIGLAARVVGRFVPVVGWILLASDLLNLLTLLGMMATPAYALACAGPAEAMAAGLPSALMKGALKREFWKMARHNPFGMKARASRALRSTPRLPGFSNLVEVAQTTDQLFGVGLSLGAWVGFASELVMAPLLLGRGQSVSINLPGEAQGVAEEARRKFGAMPPYKQRVTLQAGQVSQQAGAVWRVQDVFTEEEHLWTAVASLWATGVLYDFWHDLNLPTLTAALADTAMPPPFTPAADTIEWAAYHGRQLDQEQGWWIAGAPALATPRELAADHARMVPAALREFIEPRRNAPAGAIYGAMVTQLTDWLFMLAEGEPELFKWELTTDSRLVANLIESGWLVPVNAEKPKLWAMWQAARAMLEGRRRHYLTTEEWAALARTHGVNLIAMKPPELPVPGAWAAAQDQSLG